MKENRGAVPTAYTLSALTLFTFVVAFLATPISGPFCREGCIGYPYAEIAGRFPRDYWWMFPAMGVPILYLMVVTHLFLGSPTHRRYYPLLSLLFAVMSALILVTCYYMQLAVVQPSILRGESEGIALLTQYNPHGVFIALEEAGYLLMSLSFLSLVPVFDRTKPLGLPLRGLFLSGFLLTVVALVLITLAHGVFREYYFEVAVISIDFLVLIVGGILLALHFRRSTHPGVR